MKQNLIYYPAGCYGTFFEWVCNFLVGTTTELPFKNNGSSHGFIGHFLDPKEKIFQYLESADNFQFSRCHPNLFEKTNQQERVYQTNYADILQEDLVFLKNHFDKILALTYDSSSVLWVENNLLNKTLISEEMYENDYSLMGYTREFLKNSMEKDPVTRLRYTIERATQSESSLLTRQNLLGWGKTDIFDFDIWELREFLSLFWFTRSSGQIKAWNTVVNNTDCAEIIFLGELRNNFIGSILRVAKHFDITVTDKQIEQLEEIQAAWGERQVEMDKDQLCVSIVDSISSNTTFDWSERKLSIVDEAFIQKSLTERGIQIKCYNLNVFPKNSDDFQALLERTA